MHVLDFVVVSLQLVNDHLLVLSIGKLCLDLVEIADDLGQFVRVGLLGPSLFKKFLCLVPQLVDLVVKHVEHRLQVSVVELVRVAHIVISVLADGAAEANT